MALAQVFVSRLFFWRDRVLSLDMHSHGHVVRGVPIIARTRTGYPVSSELVSANVWLDTTSYSITAHAGDITFGPVQPQVGNYGCGCEAVGAIA